MHVHTSFLFKAYVALKLIGFSILLLWNFYNIVVGMNPMINMLHIVSMFCSMLVIGGTIALDILGLE